MNQTFPSSKSKFLWCTLTGICLPVIDQKQWNISSMLLSCFTGLWSVISSVSSYMLSLCTIKQSNYVKKNPQFNDLHVLWVMTGVVRGVFPFSKTFNLKTLWVWSCSLSCKPSPVMQQSWARAGSFCHFPWMSPWFWQADSVHLPLSLCTLLR